MVTSEIEVGLGFVEHHFGGLDDYRNRVTPPSSQVARHYDG